jgi:hypothetical protein
MFFRWIKVCRGCASPLSQHKYQLHLNFLPKLVSLSALPRLTTYSNGYLCILTFIRMPQRPPPPLEPAASNDKPAADQDHSQADQARNVTATQPLSAPATLSRFKALPNLYPAQPTPRGHSSPSPPPRVLRAYFGKLLVEHLIRPRRNVGG